MVRMNANSLPDTLSKAVVEMSELIREPELNQGTAMWESRARCGIVKGEMFRQADLTTYVLSDLGLEENGRGSAPTAEFGLPISLRHDLQKPLASHAGRFGEHEIKQGKRECCIQRSRVSLIWALGKS